MDSLSKQKRWSILLNKNITVLFFLFIFCSASRVLQPHYGVSITLVLCWENKLLCVCVCMTVWVKGWGGSWLRLFFNAPALGSPHSSCDWCAPVADRAEARARGPAEADVYLWSETASVRGPWSSNILILANTALGLIFSSGRIHQVLFLFLTRVHCAKSLLILAVVPHHCVKCQTCFQKVKKLQRFYFIFCCILGNKLYTFFFPSQRKH